MDIMIDGKLEKIERCCEASFFVPVITIKTKHVFVRLSLPAILNYFAVFNYGYGKQYFFLV